MERPLLFDAVLFDLDGTLVATDRFWIQAARTGARRAFEELGLERELPGRDEWMGLVGQPLEDGFRGLFGDLPEESWRRIMALCEEEEHRLLKAGGAALMPGAREAMTWAALHGARMGIASNCGQGYLDHMVRELELADRVDAAYCLDSAGIGDKAQMVERLLEDFATRSAIFVGDRVGDRNAAWENGIPHVHCAFGFAGHGEHVEAEARIEDMGELPSVLDRRGAWIEDVLTRLGLRMDAAGPAVVGVTGDPLAGRSLFARDAARLLRAAGLEAVGVSLAGFGAAGRGAGEGRGLEATYDLERLERELFEPLAEGRGLDLPTGARLEGGAHRHVSPEAVVVVEGPYLLDPRLQGRFDRVAYLEVDEEVLWRRLAGAVGRREGLEALEEARAGRLPAARAHRERYDPEALADLVLDGSNPLGPAPEAPSA